MQDIYIKNLLWAMEDFYSKQLRLTEKLSSNLNEERVISLVNFDGSKFIDKSEKADYTQVGKSTKNLMMRVEERALKKKLVSAIFQ